MARADDPGCPLTVPPPRLGTVCRRAEMRGNSTDQVDIAHSHFVGEARLRPHCDGITVQAADNINGQKVSGNSGNCGRCDCRWKNLPPSLLNVLTRGLRFGGGTHGRHSGPNDLRVRTPYPYSVPRPLRSTEGSPPGTQGWRLPCPHNIG